MPIEVVFLAPLPEHFARCPSCGAAPFQGFMRGEVQRHPYGWKKLWLPIGEPRPYCAVICSQCKEIVGYE